MTARPLVAVALAEEAAYLEGVRIVLTGPGKVAAATSIAPSPNRLKPDVMTSTLPRLYVPLPEG